MENGATTAARDACKACERGVESEGARPGGLRASRCRQAGLPDALSPRVQQLRHRVFVRKLQQLGRHVLVNRLQEVVGT